MSNGFLERLPLTPDLTFHDPSFHFLSIIFFEGNMGS